jgi:hypothetical protein
MADLNQKIKDWYEKLKPTKASFDRSGISPKKDWRVMLVSTFLALVICAGISLYLYIQINSGALFFTLTDNTEIEVKIDKVLLEKTINDINIRKTTLGDVIQNKSIPSDPSI